MIKKFHIKIGEWVYLDGFKTGRYWISSKGDEIPQEHFDLFPNFQPELCKNFTVLQWKPSMRNNSFGKLKCVHRTKRATAACLKNYADGKKSITVKKNTKN